MEPINWPAVIVGGLLATALGLVWPPFQTGRRPFGKTGKAQRYAALAAVMLIGAAMLGHAFARIGGATLAAKPWLYFMQSGGIALAFVMPAVWLAGTGTKPRRRAAACLYWLAAYLVIGATFWALA